jgi:subfamily B ATP-binding cassette protein MsbA
MTQVDPTLRDKASAVYEAAQFRPWLGLAVVVVSFAAALLEGVGLGLLLPIIEITQSSSPDDADGPLGLFVRFYELFGIPFTLESLIVSLGGVMFLRFALSFVSGWLRAILGVSYQRELRERLFDSLMYGPVDYIDEVGSDDLLNSFITETNRAAGIVMATFNITEVVLRGGVYLILATLLSPVLTAVAVASLTVSTLVVRYVLEPAYAVGDEVASINDELQTVSQASFQGARDVRLFNMREEFVDRMHESLDRYVASNVRLRRNQAALQNLNQFANVVVVFGLVYAGFRLTSLSIARLGVFLFAIFRLSPVVNQINNRLYTLDGQLPHLLRVRDRLDSLAEREAPATGGDRSIRTVRRVDFDDVSFSYQGSERVLDDVSFSVERGETVALVGPSGAGKSTVIALLGRLQAPDSGEIRADGTPIEDLDVREWRERLAIVRQDPFLFDGSLRENVSVGNRSASDPAIERACETAQVTEFLPELPDGYETELGEDGVRLSGGQKQRVAIARALLKDADVLVLDEATSELDSNIEQTVYEGIRSLESEYATISIAHRLSTVDGADRIYTLVDGSVTETGTHDQLLERDGTYAELYVTQS